MDEILRKLVVRIGYEVDESGRKKVDDDQTRTQAKAVAIGSLAAASIQKAAAIGVAAVKALAGALIDAVQGFADFGSEIADTSAKLGIHSGELQRLRYAAQQSGVATDSVGASLKKLQIGLVEARSKGTGPFADGLGAVGVALGELDGLSSEQQLALLGDALADIQDPAERTAAAVKLFGKAGDDMLPLLLKGAGGIGELTAEAERLGLVLDESAIASADNLGDALDRVDLQVKVAGARIGGFLAPMVEEAALGVSEWAAENRGFIETDLPAAIGGIVTTGGEMLAWLAEVIAETRQFGLEIGHAYDRTAEWATALKDDLQPAIDSVAAVVDVWADAFTGLNSTIGDGILRALDYVGVLDILRAAWDALPFTGESIDELTARLHGGGLADQVGRFARGEQPGEAPGAGRAEQDRVTAEGVAAMTAALEASTAAAKALTPQGGGRAAARDRYKAGLGRGKGGGGKADPTAARESLDRIWEGLTGGGEQEGWMDKLGGALGLGGPQSTGGGGGGSSPLAGANFSRVDNSFSSVLTIEITIPPEVAALGGAAMARTIADEVAAVVEERNRSAAEHYAQTGRSV